ncbi:MAG: endopeptidase La [Chloroflexi bacterium]|nr:endopeptidase La [Chloroflexota bacterium]
MPRRRKLVRPPGAPLSTEAAASIEMPVVPVRETVLFPQMVAPLLIARDRSLRAVEEAIGTEGTVVVVAQRDPEKMEVEFEDLYPIGTEAIVGRLLKMPDGSTNALVQGQRRVRLVSLVRAEPVMRARVILIDETVEKTLALEALMRAVLALFEKLTKLNSEVPEEAYVAAMNAEEAGALADVVVSSLPLTVAQRQEVLEVLEPAARLQKVNILLARELDVLELEDKIQTEVQQEVDKTQREYFLREQLKAIQRELGELDSHTRDVSDLRSRIEAAGLPDEVRAKTEDELRRLESMPSIAPEVGVIRTYLDWLVALPWHKATEDHLDLRRAAQVLDENHYGLSKVKERILEYMAVRKLAADRMRAPILCFVGPPGVGKTSLGRSIAQALGRKFVRVSLGGIHDEGEIRGHRRTYVGAMPGRIIQTMRTAGTVNPVFMLDEIDKIGADFRGDPAAALLEALDPEQNHAFSDHYLDAPFDLSRVMFITTANVLDPIPPALRDRLEVIEVPGYTQEEKLEIARQFLLPKQLAEHGLASRGVRFSTSALEKIIVDYTREAGVRNLEREIAAVCRKVARRVAERGDVPHAITATAVVQHLGPVRYHGPSPEERDEVGVATGVYWTTSGGELATVEATLMAGKGNLILTGQLGDVMKESATAALSYIRSRASPLGLPEKFHEGQDIHIHLPAGAIPKDGPSAGITMATALISALTRRPVRRDVAMTGEITLRGRVLPIGGLKEKVLAAHRAGIKTFILPRKNEPDLSDVPSGARRQVQFIFVDHMDEVLSVALAVPARDGQREPVMLAGPVAR